MECAEQRAAAALTFPNQSSLTERDAAGKRTVRVTLMTRSSAELRVDRTLLRRSKTCCPHTYGQKTQTTG
ncbi:hypothetical protein ABVT39_007705 [Epinephelus coioides]